MKKCVYCGKPLPEREPGKPGPKPKYCSEECRRKADNQGGQLVCSYCGRCFDPWTPNWGGIKYCSDECKGAAARARWGTHICKQCGKEFSRRDVGAGYCSRRCNSLANGIPKGGNDWAGHNKIWRDERMANSIYRARRRTRLRGAMREDIDPTAVFERDGWICGICGKKVNPRLKYPDPRSASLDHIVPLNKGGDHVWSNVQLAHFGCNSGKRDHGGGQLRLALAAA